MKAMQYRAYGGPDKIVPAEVERPRPGDTQLLVKVSAASVNPLDWKLHSGAYRFIMPVKFPSIPGYDLCGEVVEAGAKVTRFAPGDRVFAMADRRGGGTCAEYAVIGEGVAAAAPVGLSDQEAAALPLAGLTALQALRDQGKLTAAHRVLVVGASGGVGHLAVQIAKAYGAHVTAVCGPTNVDKLRTLGANQVIDYTAKDDFKTGAPYDVIFDTVCSKPIRTILPVMAAAGVYVSTLPSVGRIAYTMLLPLYAKRRLRMVGVKSNGRDLATLAALAEQGKLRPVIHKVFPLDALAEAHTLSKQGHVAGKLVIDIAG